MQPNGLAISLEQARAAFARDLPDWCTPELLAVGLRTAWPDRSSRSLLALARRWALHFALMNRDHELLGRGATCGRVRNGGPLRDLAKSGRGCIVLSFHLGPFHYVPIELGRLGYDVDVIMNSRSHRSESPGWDSAIHKIGKAVTRIDAETPNGLLNAARALKAGRAVVVYIDAELGAGGRAREERMLELDFLGLPMGFRLGPLLLAARTGVPVVCARTSHSLRSGRAIEFSEPGYARDEHEAKTLLEGAVRWFEAAIAKSPEEWLGWGTLTYCWTAVGGSAQVTASALRERIGEVRSFLERSPQGRGRTLRADPTEVGILELGGAPTLLHGRTRRFIKADGLSVDLVRAAFKGLKLDGDTAARLDSSPDRLSETIARLTLSNLAELSSR